MLNLNAYIVTTLTPGNAAMTNQTARVLAESPADAVAAAKAETDLCYGPGTMFLAAIDNSCQQ